MASGARSLKCGTCGTLLASVAEAQTHNEVTGHTNFEETTEVLLAWLCSACGKRARSVAEKKLHERMNGPDHSQWTETTLGALDTEAQMASAREELQDEADVVRAALGKAPRKQAGEEHEPQRPASSSDGRGTGSGDGAMVSPSVDEALVTELEGMGFGRNRAVRGVYHSGGAGVEAAVTWLADHEADGDLDTPLLVTQASEDAAAKLTPEERKRKAAELLKAARDKREREERELALHRERERIRAGKELQAAKRKEDEGALARMVEQRRREKEEEAAARAKLEAQLAEDRKERRRRLGLPEELTPQEQAREAAKAAEKAKKADEEKKKVFGGVRPVSTLDKLRTTAVAIKKEYSANEGAWRTVAATLVKYIGNVVAAPDEDKFRSIRTTNAAFQQRVAAVNGGVAFLELCGFEAQGEVLVLPRDKVDLEVLQGAGAVLSDMLANPFFGAL